MNHQDKVDELLDPSEYAHGENSGTKKPLCDYKGDSNSHCRKPICPLCLEEFTRVMKVNDIIRTLSTDIEDQSL